MSGVIECVLADASEREGEQSRYEELEWYAFPQMWGSTALGFGGVGGSTMTVAQTFVVFGDGRAYVYIGGRFAYHTDDLRQARDWVLSQRVPSVAAARR